MFSKRVQPRKEKVAFLDWWNTVMVPLSIHFPKKPFIMVEMSVFEGDFLGKVCFPSANVLEVGATW